MTTHLKILWLKNELQIVFSDCILTNRPKLSSLWKESDLETKQKIQKLTFPKGIFWDKENGSYRTDGRNEVYDIIERISADYKQKEENPLELSSSVQLCTPLTNYRTLIEGFIAVLEFMDWYDIHRTLFT